MEVIHEAIKGEVRALNLNFKCPHCKQVFTIDAPKVIIDGSEGVECRCWSCEKRFTLIFNLREISCINCKYCHDYDIYYKCYITKEVIEEDPHEKAICDDFRCF
jgi:predicted Zn finger-like uncharacterized protein